MPDPRRRAPRCLALFLTIFLAGPLAPPVWGSSQRDAAPGCVHADAGRAAQTLYGSGTELGPSARIAGLATALVLEPLISPGTRHRMIEAHGQWCDATTGFNSAWRLLDLPRDAQPMAEAYVRLAAAPYFDGVKILGAEAIDRATFAITTHARTNGVVADWIVSTDPEGIDSATWTASRTGVRPFVAEWEGLTALPGATESYVETATGVLNPVRGLPIPRSTEDTSEGPTLRYEATDGFNIVVSLGDARVAPNVGQDTGVTPLDALRTAYRTAAENYEEFLGWGLEKGWRPALGGPEDEGYVYIDDALSFYCLACVFIADDFQIHMRSDVVTQLADWGYTYPDHDQAFSTIMGHEMFHNFQNAYIRPGYVHEDTGRDRSVAFSEGTARFQETLHSYSDVSYQDGSLVTAPDGNGCNGFDWPDMDTAMSEGPFEFHSYDSCYFWMSWFAHEGIEGMVDLVAEEIRKAAHLPGYYEELAPAIVEASGDDLVTQLIRWAESAITGTHMSWSRPSTGEARDWSSLIERWEPPLLNPGQKVTMWLSDGGVMARELQKTAPVYLEGPQGGAPAGASLFVIRQDAEGVTVERPASGTEVLGPQPGEKVWVGIVYPRVGGAQATLRFGGTSGSTPSPTPSTSPTPIGYTTHSDSGHIEIGHPTNSYVGVSTTAFLEECQIQEQTPDGTQGLDAFVFALPEGFDSQGSTFTLRGTSPYGAIATDVDVDLYTEDCRYTRTYAASGDEVDAPVLPATHFLVAEGWSGVDIDVTLEVKSPIWPEPEPTPTGSSTASPSPTPEPTPTEGPECVTQAIGNFGDGNIGRGVSFSSPTEGWVAALSKIFVTHDGGKSWEVDHTVPESQLAIAAPTNERAISGGIGDKVVFTHDAGGSWENVKHGDYLPFPAQSVSLRAIDFVDADHGWAVGTNTEGVFLLNRALILGTSDGGRTWTHQETGQQWLSDVDFVNRQVGYAVGGANLRTVDGGETWETMASAPTGLSEIVAISPTEVYGFTTSNDVFSTTDGGSTWVKGGRLGGAPFAITGTSERLFVSGQGYVATSSDGGQTWATEQVANGHNLIDITMRTPHSAVTVGTGGHVVETTCRKPLDTAHLTFTDLSARRGQYSDTAVIEAKLTGPAGEGLAEKEIRFTLGAGEVVVEASSATDASGVASVSIPLDQAPGGYTVVANFAGIPGQMASAEVSIPFTIDHEQTDLSLAIAGRGARRTLAARLFDPDSSAGIAGRVVEYFVDGLSIGCGTTDETGSSVISVPPRYSGPGHEFAVRFLGDTFYLPAHVGPAGEPVCAAPSEPSPTPTPAPG